MKKQEAKKMVDEMGQPEPMSKLQKIIKWGFIVFICLLTLPFLIPIIIGTIVLLFEDISTLPIKLLVILGVFLCFWLPRKFSAKHTKNSSNNNNDLTK